MKFAYLLAVCAALVSVPLAAFAALPVTPVPVESRGDRQFGNLCRYVSHNRWSLDYIIAHSVESSPVGEPTLTPAELRAFQAIRDRCVDDKLSGTAADIWTSPLLGRLSRAIGRAFLAATKQRCIAAKATPADKALVLKVIDGPNGLARPGVDPLHEKLAKLKASLSGGAVDCDALDHHQWAALLSVEAQPTAARTAFAEEFGAGGQAVVEVAIGPGLDLTAAKLPGPVQSNPAPASSVEAAIIQGVTDFVVSRAKAEVADYALGKLRGLMCDGQAAPWFENSCAYLGDGTSDLGVLLGDGLRKAFSRDVATAPRVALELIKPDASVVKERRLFAAWVALEALVGFIDTRTPAGVVARLAAEQPVPWTDANLRSLAEDVRIVAIVVRAALAQSSKLRGPTPDDLGFIQAVLDDLQQEAVTLQASAPTSAQKLLDLCGKLSAITDHALQAKQLVARVKAVVHDVESVENGKTQAERTTAGISAVRGTADLVNQVLQLVGGANVGADAKLQAEIAALADLLEASIRGDLTSLIGALTKDLNVFLVELGALHAVQNEFRSHSAHWLPN